LRLDLPDDVRTLSSEEATEFLKEHVARRLAEPGMATTTLAVRMHVRVGTPADEIVALAKELDADLIVVGTHGRRGVRRLLLGSVARAILRHAGCPVLVVRQKQTDEDHHD
jgi:nucleotide-binding universal stress UspA family protein